MASQTLLRQPGFAAQIKKLPSPLGIPIDIERGYMVWQFGSKDQGANLGYTGGPFGDGRDVIYFLYNPATVSSQFAVGNGTLQAAMMYPVPGSTGTLLAPLQQSVAFDLYFDRTFEVNYGTGPVEVITTLPGGKKKITNYLGTGAVNDPGVIGCQADVLQFMQFTGMLASLTSSDVAALGVSGESTYANGATANGNVINQAVSGGGIMMMMPCYLYLSNVGASFNSPGAANGSLNYGAVNYQLTYFGYISSFSVQYTHWSNSMIPLRCVVSVSFTMLPNPQQKDAIAVATDVYNAGLFSSPGGNPAYLPGGAGFPVPANYNPNAPGIGGR
jgi:hypothetical protein